MPGYSKSINKINAEILDVKHNEKGKKKNFSKSSENDLNKHWEILLELWYKHWKIFAFQSVREEKAK